MGKVSYTLGLRVDELTTFSRFGRRNAKGGCEQTRFIACAVLVLLVAVMVMKCRVLIDGGTLVNLPEPEGGVGLTERSKILPTYNC